MNIPAYHIDIKYFEWFQSNQKKEKRKAEIVSAKIIPKSKNIAEMKEIANQNETSTQQQQELQLIPEAILKKTLRH